MFKFRMRIYSNQNAYLFHEPECMSLLTRMCIYSMFKWSFNQNSLNCVQRSTMTFNPYHTQFTFHRRRQRGFRPPFKLMLQIYFETSNYRVFPTQLWSRKCSFRSRCFRSRTTELSTIFFPVSTYTISFLLIIITNDKSKLDMCNDPKCPKVSN